MPLPFSPGYYILLLCLTYYNPRGHDKMASGSLRKMCFRDRKRRRFGT